MDLRVAVDGESERTIRPGDVLTVGRAEDAGITVQDPEVSRLHLTVEWRDGAWWAEDAGSSNGTFADGTITDSIRVDRALTLRLGDIAGVAVRLEPSEPTSPGGDTPTLGRETIILEDLTTPAPGPVPTMGTAFPASVGSVIVIGREDADIVIDDLLVSRRHAEIEILAPDAAEVRDLRSSNGTYLDGRRLTRGRLTERSVLTIGRTNLVLRDGQILEHHDDGRLEFVVERLAVHDARGRPIVRDISFEVPPRSLVGVLGPSGAGKSTVIKALVGAVSPSGGSVFYGGVDLLEGLSSTRRRIGYVPQDDILHGNLTVDRSLEYAARLRLSADATAEEAHERIGEVLDQLGLGAHRHKRVDQLSGGQRKRASTAMELLTRPPLLMLDEPSSGLDPGNEKALMELLADIAHEETDTPNSARRVLVVTHSVQSLHVCDLVLVLAPGSDDEPGGSIAYFGPPEELLDHFGVDDPADVFRLLEQEAADWRMPPGVSVRPRESRSWVRDLGLGGERAPLPRRTQLRLLTRRYLDVIAADRPNLWLLALQAPAVGLMIALITADAFVPQPDRPVSGLLVLLLGLVLSITYLAASNSVRELVKERAIFQRERALGVDPLAHVGAKLLVLGVLTILQSVALVFVATARAGDLEADSVLDVPGLTATLELVLVVALTGLAAVGLGLLISALVSNADKAMTILPVLLLAMYLLSGGPTDVDGSPVVREVSWVNSARWGLTGAAQATDAESLLLCDGTSRFAELTTTCRDAWSRSNDKAVLSVVLLAGLAVGSVVAATVLVARRRP